MSKRFKCSVIYAVCFSMSVAFWNKLFSSNFLFPIAFIAGLAAFGGAYFAYARGQKDSESKEETEKMAD